MALRAVRIAAAARARCHAVVPRPVWLGSIVRYIAISSVVAAPGGGKKKSVAEPPPVDEAGGADVGAADDPASEGKDLKTALARHVEYARRELSQVRVATANPNMLDNVMVEAYDDMMPLKELAQIVLKNPTTFTIVPFDVAVLNNIAQAIRASKLNLNPVDEGRTLRVPLPKSTKETREVNVKLISKIAEAAKTRIRRTRQSAMDALKKAGEGVSQDAVFREMKEVQAATNAATEEVAKLAEQKKLEAEASRGLE